MKECEYCGNHHDVRELCSARRGMSRRRFFSLSARAIVGVALAPQIIEAAAQIIAPSGVHGIVLESPSLLTVGGINRATFKFWRNQQIGATALDMDDDAMRRIFNECTAGPRA